MAKFKKKKKGGSGAINTASLPDIVFMLLFFFMVSTTMKEVEMKVITRLPEATELSRLERKSLVTYIYVGVPMRQYQRSHGTEPRIQLNDQFATPEDIQSFIAQEREAMREHERPLMTVSIKADYDCPMGIITDIKQALRRAQALRINYSARQGDDLAYNF
ncbi:MULTISPECIES: ExbD/TolR family protein [Marinilabiliaceae]|uniref:Biopolymer transport protein ExbD n=2 Tax=Marinilabiliaceae TaxID=558415 RepID=A0A1T5BXU5_9BACT|nr:MULTISPECIES: biopolymer transporter ExbD [Marinilabiliaceae]ASB49553.1 biopolymer transporter ExbD [Alkalitalea saponilacus]TCO08013.1 biopolymer transport protein ExbD [Natronoflexus pectinivorans]SKB51969.1 Biopolymer transport protein ExbD [Alkalitalea saponilacus]